MKGIHMKQAAAAKKPNTPTPIFMTRRDHLDVMVTIGEKTYGRFARDEDGTIHVAKVGHVFVLGKNKGRIGNPRYECLEIAVNSLPKTEQMFLGVEPQPAAAPAAAASASAPALAMRVVRRTPVAAKPAVSTEAGSDAKNPIELDVFAEGEFSYPTGAASHLNGAYSPWQAKESTNIITFKDPAAEREKNVRSTLLGLMSRLEQLKKSRTQAVGLKAVVENELEYQTLVKAAQDLMIVADKIAQEKAAQKLQPAARVITLPSAAPIIAAVGPAPEGAVESAASAPEPARATRRGWKVAGGATLTLLGGLALWAAVERGPQQGEQTAAAKPPANKTVQLNLGNVAGSNNLSMNPLEPEAAPDMTTADIAGVEMGAGESAGAAEQAVAEAIAPASQSGPEIQVDITRNGDNTRATAMVRPVPKPITSTKAVRRTPPKPVVAQLASAQVQVASNTVGFEDYMKKPLTSIADEAPVQTGCDADITSKQEAYNRAVAAGRMNAKANMGMMSDAHRIAIAAASHCLVKAMEKTTAPSAVVEAAPVAPSAASLKDQTRANDGAIAQLQNEARNTAGAAAALDSHLAGRPGVSYAPGQHLGYQGVDVEMGGLY